MTNPLHRIKRDTLYHLWINPSKDKSTKKFLEENKLPPITYLRIGYIVAFDINHMSLLLQAQKGRYMRRVVSKETVEREILNDDTGMEKVEDFPELSITDFNWKVFKNGVPIKVGQVYKVTSRPLMFWKQTHCKFCVFPDKTVAVFSSIEEKKLLNGSLDDLARLVSDSDVDYSLKQVIVR